MSMIEPPGDVADPHGPPHSIEAEQALLGAIIFDNEAYERLDGLVTGLHFFEPLHGRLFDAIESRIRRGQLAEPIALADMFTADPAYRELGGLRYLADLVDRAPPAATARDFGRLIKELAGRRDIIRMAGEIDASARDPGDMTLAEIVESAERGLYAVAEEQGKATGLVAFADALDGAVDMAAAAYERDGGLSGLSTGLTDLDRKLGGLHASDLIILAARPSMGKSALASNISFTTAKNGGAVAFFSLEMSSEQLCLRILAEVSGVSGDRLRKGEIKAHEFDRVRDARDEIRNAPLHIDDTAGLNIAQLRTRARRMKRRHGLDLIVVDYLQLASGSREARQGGRVQEVSEITVGLKAMAKELGVPVLALSQLSRQVENREDKRPQLSDLRESGSIEQDADAVMFIYREAYYQERLEPREGTPEHLTWQDNMDRCANLAEVIIGKHRHGPIGTVKLHFNGDLTKFTNLAHSQFEGVNGR